MSVLSSPLFRQQCYINGQWKDADSGETIDVTNPATGAVLGTVPKMGAAETATAIEGARVAQKEWAQRTAKERHGVMIKWFNLMMEHQDALGGIPASAANSAIRIVDKEVCSAGFRTTVFPVARIGPNFQAAIIAGKFQGRIAATTPIGSRIIIESTLGSLGEI